MKMSNRWNQLIYRLWAPIYDSTIEHFFKQGRQRAMDVLDLQPGEFVLIVGAGTGADLPLLPEGAKGIGLDLSREMLKKAKQKLPHCRAKMQLIQGDAQALCLMDNQFDAALLNLILSVVPDGNVLFARIPPGTQAGRQDDHLRQISARRPKTHPYPPVDQFFQHIIGHGHHPQIWQDVSRSSMYPDKR